LCLVINCKIFSSRFVVQFNMTGIYIPETRTSVPNDLRGLGMRIEDDVLVTANGPYNLCSQCPKQPDEIESLMSS